MMNLDNDLWAAISELQHRYDKLSSKGKPHPSH
jgi:hypothetical protein